MVSKNCQVADYYCMFAKNLSNDLFGPLCSPNSAKIMFTPSPSISCSSSIPSPSSFDELCDGEPYLEILEEPVPNFRFRYRSEMQGAHGSLLARGEEGSKRKRYPSAQLHNYRGDAFIRCSLYTADVEPLPHIHQLLTVKNNQDVLDHEQLVSDRNSYKAEFRGLGIVLNPKHHLKDELVRKRVQKLKEKLKQDDTVGHIRDEVIEREINCRLSKIEADAEKDAKSIDKNKNSATLCFEAFVKDERGRVDYLCKPVFSKPIQNMKSAETCELKICRMDRYTGNCRGGEEVFILVEKVSRGNIKVRFYEEDDLGNEVWEDYASFQDYDVHHQYAIVFKTPPYRNPDIEERVQVKVQLYRPKNKQYSEPLEFVYKPARQFLRKRRSTSSSFNSVEAKRVLIQPSSEDLSPMLSDKDPMLSGDPTSLGSLSCQSDILRRAVAQFCLDESGEPQDLLRQFPTVNLEDYLGVKASKSCDVFENQNFLNVNAVAVDGVTASCKDPLLKGVTIDGANKQDLKLLGPPRKTESKEQDIITSVKEACNRLQVLILSDEPSRTEEIKKLLKAKDYNIGPLHAAVIHGQLKELSHILSLLIKGGLYKLINTVNHLKETALLLAVKKNKADCVKVLLLAGADANVADIDQYTAVHWALKSANRVILEQLLDHNKHDKSFRKVNLTNLNRYGETPLHIALQLNGFEEEKHKLIDLLLTSGASPNFTLGGDTPLMLAVLEDDPVSVKLLLKAGADLSISGPREFTALHLAVESKHHECLNVLLSYGLCSKKKNIQINKKNEDGESPLHLAVRMKDAISVGLLINAGCNVNEKIPTCGNTPLHLAIQNFSPAIIEALLSEELINIDEENFSCLSPTDMAGGDLNQEKLSELLKKFQIPCVEVKEELISDEGEQDIPQSDKSMKLIEKMKALMGSHMEDRGNYPSHKSTWSSKYKTKSKELSTLFDHETFKTIVRLLDNNKKWVDICRKLDCSFLISSLMGMKSPASGLISYIEFNENLSVKDFKKAVEEVGVLDVANAIDCIPSTSQGAQTT